MIEGYEFQPSAWHETCDELMPLYRMHYAEYRERQARQGIDVPGMALQMDSYLSASRRGDIAQIVARKDGVAVGYLTVFLARDMHNGDLIMQEDSLFVHPEHRRGVGRHMCRLMISAGKALGVRRIHLSASTDPRATALWVRMGAVPSAVQLVYAY